MDKKRDETPINKQNIIKKIRRRHKTDREVRKKTLKYFIMSLFFSISTSTGGLGSSASLILKSPGQSSDTALSLRYLH